LGERDGVIDVVECRKGDGRDVKLPSTVVDRALCEKVGLRRVDKAERER
jgi:hypothetical protein